MASGMSTSLVAGGKGGALWEAGSEGRTLWEAGGAGRTPREAGPATEPQDWGSATEQQDWRPATGVLSRRMVEPGKQEAAEAQLEETAAAQELEIAAAQEQWTAVAQEPTIAAAQAQWAAAAWGLRREEGRTTPTDTHTSRNIDRGALGTQRRRNTGESTRVWPRL